jgi:hypothetical protein
MLEKLQSKTVINTGSRQASPELEMLRRKERIEKWRAQKRKKELDISAGKVWLDGLYN